MQPVQENVLKRDNSTFLICTTTAPQYEINPVLTCYLEPGDFIIWTECGKQRVMSRHEQFALHSMHRRALAEDNA